MAEDKRTDRQKALARIGEAGIIAGASELNPVLGLASDIYFGKKLGDNFNEFREGRHKRKVLERQAAAEAASAKAKAEARQARAARKAARPAPLERQRALQEQKNEKGIKQPFLIRSGNSIKAGLGRVGTIASALSGVNSAREAYQDPDKFVEGMPGNNVPTQALMSTLNRLGNDLTGNLAGKVGQQISNRIQPKRKRFK